MTSVKTLAELEGYPHAVAFPDAEPRTIRLTLDEGESVPAHTHPDREIVCYLIDGELALNIGGDTYELTAGDVARFDGDQEISPTARTASTALLVLAPRPE